MGSFFSNLHIRRRRGLNGQMVMRCVEQMMQMKNYEAVLPQQADTEVVIVNSRSSDWFSVYCDDAFEWDDEREIFALVAPLSAELKTDVLNIGCFDSDYLYMNLINTEESVDAWVSVGKLDEDAGELRQSEPAAWANKVRNFEAFRAAFEKENTFMEDVLDEIEECLCLPRAFSNAGSEDFEDASQEDAVRMYFKRTLDRQPHEKPRFEVVQHPAAPCCLESVESVGFLNAGSASKGLSVYFVGEYVEHEELRFSDVSLAAYKHGDTMPKRMPVELKKGKLADGRWAYWGHVPDIMIPQKIDTRLSEAKQWNQMLDKTISVCFVSHGNRRKVLDITVVLVPDENPEGQAAWCIWHRYGSKAEYIRQYNEGCDGVRWLPLKETDFD